MSNNKRKRAVVLALIAFFCGTAYVAVDWKRFGGGFLAMFKHKGDPVLATGGGSLPGAGAPVNVGNSHPSAGPVLQLASATSHRRTSSVGGGSGAHKSDDDLFKYGDPAAGGIPAGSFVVAQNDTPGGGNSGGAGAPPAIGAPTLPEIAGATSGGDAGGGVTSPAPAPAGGNGGSGDIGIVVKSPSPPAATPPSSSTPPAPPAPTPPAPSPASPAPAPTQSGTSDQNPGDGDGGTGTDPTGGGSVPVTPTPPVSAVPEASNAAMMGLGALFLAVAATRKRKSGQA